MKKRLLMLTVLFAAGRAFAASSSTAAAFLSSAAPLCGTEERQEADKATALNIIAQQKAQQRMSPIIEARDESAVKYAAFLEKQKLELAPLEGELKRLQLESGIQDEKFRKETNALRQERERLRIANDVAREKLAAEQVKIDGEKIRLEAALRELDFQSRKLRLDAEAAEHKTVSLKADLELREKRNLWKKAVDREPDYAKEPFKDGVLTISDRRVSLNGPIVYGVADFVSERISYYNNKSAELPIFLVIDNSPGGSVMEGERIIKAVRASRAPVHVVVKSYAASMAAAIATLAPHSYAYPNAIILHHQPIGVTIGNPTQQKQQLEIINDWQRRMLAPVAQKMGLSLEAFTKKMYERSVDGDWAEFADGAAKLAWVDRVVRDIRETGVLKEPEDRRDEKPKPPLGLAEESDPRGERFVRLPRLQSFDAYFLYNKDGYYR